MSEKERIGLHIVEARERLGLNQSEFARELGISRTGLHLYESGKRIISTDVLLKIYDKFNVTPNEILIAED